MGQRRLTDAIQLYARHPADRLPALLADRLAADPRCPVTRFLLGCQGFDRGRVATAVRHMMVAHHSAPQLESAALLVFAGLNWLQRRGAPLLPVLLDTWDEFRRPEFDRLPLERRLLDAFAAPDPGLARVGPLAWRLWRLPMRTLRQQLTDALRSRDTVLYPLLTAPA